MQNNNQSNKLSIAEIIAKYKMENNIDSSKEQALLVAASLSEIDNLRSLLQSVVNVNYQDFYSGKTALHYAVSAASTTKTETHRGLSKLDASLACVELLLKYGAKELPDVEGKLPLDYAARSPMVFNMLRGYQRRYSGDARVRDIAGGSSDGGEVRSEAKVEGVRPRPKLG